MEFGSILSGIGAVAQGFGLGGSGGETASPTDYVNANYYGLKGKHSFAKKYGYNPNYLMGGSVAAPVVTDTGQGTAPGLIGAGLGEIASGAMAKKEKQSPTAKAMQALGVRQAEAETKNSEIQAEMAALELARQQQALNAQPTKAAPTSKTYPYRPGLVTGKPMPMWVAVEDRDGNIHHFPNPELGVELPETFGAGMLGTGIYRPEGHEDRGLPGTSPRSGRYFRVPRGPGMTGGY